MATSRIRLPRDVRDPYEVYLNGVPQRLGEDFTVREGALVFPRELRKDRISSWRWLLGAWGVGTYRQNDSVDVRYEARDRAGVDDPLPRPGELQGTEDRPCSGRAVERVEVDPRRAGGEQLGALKRRIGDAEVEHRLGVLGAAMQLAPQ